MNDGVVFYIVISILFLLFALFGYMANKVLAPRKTFVDTRQTYEYNKYKQSIFNNITALTKCIDHLSLAQIMIELDKSLDYFEKHNLTMFDRPPEKIRASTVTYATMLLEDIYRGSTNKEIEVDIFSEKDLETLEEYRNKSEEEKQSVINRRNNYKKKLQEKIHFNKLHHKQNMMDYLDEQTARKLREIQDKKLTPARLGAL